MKPCGNERMCEFDSIVVPELALLKTLLSHGSLKAIL